MIVWKILPYILAVPRSLFYCIRLFGWKGWRLPVVIASNVRVKGLKRGSIEVPNMRPFQVRIGFEGIPYITAGKGIVTVLNEGRMIFHGTAYFRQGISICVDGGTLEIGDQFRCNKNVFLSCSDRLEIGTDVMIGWNTSIRDVDGHGILHKGVLKPAKAPVHIGNHVWIAAFVDILKGVSIADNNVVAYRSCVTKSVDENNVLIAGYPAKVIQHDIDWQLDES